MGFPEFDFSAASITLYLLLASAAQLSARDVRPSDHGLQYQQSKPAGGNASPPQMMSFFGASSTPPTPPSSSAIPKATHSDSTDSSWMRPSGSGRKERVREILLVVSLVCGVTGVALLIGSALLFLVKFRKENPPAQKSTSTRPQSLPPSSAVGN